MGGAENTLFQKGKGVVLLAGSGDTKISVFEFVLGSIGMFVIAGLILLGGGLGLLFGLPYVLIGLFVGIVASWAFISGSFAGTLNVKCPDCGNKQKLAGFVGSYQCSNCGRMVVIKNKEQEVNLYSAFPTD